MQKKHSTQSDRVSTHSSAQPHRPPPLQTQAMDCPPLPANRDAERCVLGSILVKNEYLKRVIGTLEASDYFLPEHRTIFTRMLSMAKAGQAIDLVTLTEDLERSRKLEAAGGAGYVAQLADGVPQISNVEHYAQIVKEKSLLRNLAHAGDGITRAALRPDAEPGLIVKQLEMVAAQYREQVWAEKKMRFLTGAR